MQTKSRQTAGPLLYKVLSFLDLFDCAFDRQKTLGGTGRRHQGMDLRLGLISQVL